MAAHFTEITTTTDSFRIGVQMGRDDVYRGRLGITLTEECIVGIVRNLVEIGQEGWLRDELIRRDVGVIVGMLTK